LRETFFFDFLNGPPFYGVPEVFFFLIRQHASTLTWKLVGKRKRCGKTASGTVYEQAAQLTNPATGATLVVRRIPVELPKPTRDGETQIHLLTNVPARAADAKQVSWYYVCTHVAKVYEGMMMAVPARHWRLFRKMEDAEFAGVLRQLATNIDLAKFQKHPRGPKKPPPKKTSGAKIKHVATARIIAKR
jgi:hypothetical protein